jgi:eukaryotic-like serine/threonine-protein kinase
MCSWVRMPARPEDDPTAHLAREDAAGGDGERASAEQPMFVEQATLNSGPPLSGARRQTPNPSRALTTLDTERFIEREIIGRGGSAVVVRAFDRDLLREVAIKVLDPELGDVSPEVDRFAEEARINGQLEHPNIVPVYQLGIDQRGRRFLCMKFVQGVTLEEALSRLGPSRLEPDRLADFLQVFGKVCDAVSYAHSRGVIHRDLKPTNVMINDFGQVYVLDWGIARLRPPHAEHQGPRVQVTPDAEHSELDPPGSLVGTACYMAPEQLHGKHDKLDERTDVFALGATLYQILTGQPPLTADIVRAIWTRKAPPAIEAAERVGGDRVPLELARIALRALSYDPTQRYASVADLKRDVESFLRGAWDLRRTSLPAGSIVVAEGEPGSAAYVILEGHCIAYRVEGRTEVELRVMGPGEVFGETAVLSDKPRTASVKAATNVVLVEVTRDALSKGLGLNSWMGAFVRALANRFREADERLRVLERAGRAARQGPESAKSPESGGALQPSQRGAEEVTHSAFPAGSIIVAEGEGGDAAYLIVEGSCVAYRLAGSEEVELRVMGPGDVFGETAVFSDKPRTASVRAATDVLLVAVTRDALRRVLGLNSWMGAFVKALAERFREVDERALSLTPRETVPRKGPASRSPP